MIQTRPWPASARSWAVSETIRMSWLHAVSNLPPFRPALSASTKAVSNSCNLPASCITHSTRFNACRLLSHFFAAFQLCKAAKWDGYRLLQSRKESYWVHILVILNSLWRASSVKNAGERFDYLNSMFHIAKWQANSIWGTNTVLFLGQPS